MVNPLPTGVSLNAIFDSCHSGTLLDLNHYECYTVEVNSEPRKLETKRTKRILSSIGVCYALDYISGDRLLLVYG